MKLFTVVVLIMFSAALSAQVDNDNIESRSLLIADSISIHSNTSNSSVEWKCVNRSLTNKCLVYHNDQWFYFTVPDQKKYFLNIYRQDCRDNRGLQLILIEGNPCQTETYKIIQCIDKIPRDDVFISLESLKKGVQYLVNIDGFLNDYCEFNIELSTRPIGFPYQMISEDILPTSIHMVDSIVNIQIDASIDQLNLIKSLEVFRSYSKDSHSGNTKSSFIKSIPIERNAAGNLVDRYNFYDTLNEKGVYKYRLISEGHEGERKLFLDRSLKYSGYVHEFIQPPLQQSFIHIPIERSRKRTAFDVYVYDALTNNLLLYKMFSIEKGSNTPISLNVRKYVDEGVRNFLVKVIDQKKPGVGQYKFSADVNGNITSRK